MWFVGCGWYVLYKKSLPDTSYELTLYAKDKGKYHHNNLWSKIETEVRSDDLKARHLTRSSKTIVKMI